MKQTTFPIHVPAGGTASLCFELEVLAAGPVQAHEQLLLEQEGVSSVTLSVQGGAENRPRD